MNNIEISISNIGNNINIFIDIPNNKIIINNQKKEITKEKIYDLLRIIRDWNNLYPKNNNELDSEKFIITITTTNNIDIIKGEGTYPENYIEFKNWIGEINE